LALLETAFTLDRRFTHVQRACKGRTPGVFVKFLRPDVIDVDKGEAEPAGVGKRTTDQQRITDDAEVLELLVVEVACERRGGLAHWCAQIRSEERRVGKEWRARGGTVAEKKK